MAQPESGRGRFDEFLSYYDNLEEMMENYEKIMRNNEELDSESVEPHKKFGNKLAHLSDPGWHIYKDINEYGRAELLHSLTEEMIEENDEHLVGTIWKQFENVDEILQSPEEHIYSRLRNAGMDEEMLDHIKDSYQESVEPLISGERYEEE